MGRASLPHGLPRDAAIGRTQNDPIGGAVGTGQHEQGVITWKRRGRHDLFRGRNRPGRAGTEGVPTLAGVVTAVQAGWRCRPARYDWLRRQARPQRPKRGRRAASSAPARERQAWQEHSKWR